MQWADSLDSARLMTQTVGAEPLIIEATGDATQTDILLRTGDALGIYEANLGNGNFLGKGRVVIVSGSVTESVTESVPKSVTERAAKDTSPE